MGDSRAGPDPPPMVSAATACARVATFDAIAKDVAVLFSDDIADVDADAQLKRVVLILPGALALQA